MRDGLWAAGHRMRKVDLGSREFERELVSRLTSGKPLAELARWYSEASVSRALTALVHAGIIAPAPAVVLFVNLVSGAGLEGATNVARADEVKAADLAVVLSEPSNPTLTEVLRAARTAGIPTLAGWISGAHSLAFAFDDGVKRPCVHCALLFDGSSRSSAHRVDAVAEGARSRFEAAAIGEADRRPLEQLALSWLAALLQPGAARPAIGLALSLEVAQWQTAWEPFAAHPSCYCVGPSEPAQPGPAGWDDARARRFSPVVCVDAGGAGRPARALFRQSRSASDQTVDDFGVASATGEAATLRAFAEGVERFCMLHAWPDIFRTARLRLDQPAIEHDDLASLLFRESEYEAPRFRHPRYSTSLELDWTWATQLRTGTRALVPTSLIGRPSAGSPRLVDASSNGYAAHTDRERAVQLAVLEIVERDAVLRSWYLSRPMPRILGDLRVRPTQADTEVRCFLATSDVELPVVLAVARLPEGSLRAAASAAVSFEEAWRKVALELQSGLEASAPGRSAGVSSDLNDPARRDGPLDQLKYYLDPERARPALDHLWKMSETVELPALGKRWPRCDDGQTTDRITAAIERAGLTAWIVDRSLPDVFDPKWHVVRALVPGAVEISWGQAYRRLASPRLTRPLAEGASLNPLPHVIA